MMLQDVCVRLDSDDQLLLIPWISGLRCAAGNHHPMALGEALS